MPADDDGRRSERAAGPGWAGGDLTVVGRLRRERR